YNYYMYVAESYNSNFRYGRQFLRNIENKYLYLNPDYQQGWKEPDSDEMKIFEGSIRKNDKGYVFKSTDLQSFFIISNKHKFKLKDGMKAKANLSFLLNGIRAIIIEIL